MNFLAGDEKNAMDRAIYAVDIGSTRKSRTREIAFAWVRIHSQEVRDIVADRHIDRLATSLRSDLESGVSVSLGFEAPLFIPIPTLAADLSRGRSDEGNRAWCAPAGLAVTSLAIHQIAWVLRSLVDLKQPELLTTDPRDWPPDNAQRLFCWEAFVSGPAHSDDHIFDAATAAAFFRDNEHSLSSVGTVTTDIALSLFHTAALWAGWLEDIDCLKSKLPVVRPTEPYRGCVRPMVTGC